MQETKRLDDREALNIVFFAFWALLEALQLLVIIVFIFSFIPIKPNPFVGTLFPMHQKGVLPEREMLFYRIFVFAAMALQAASLYIFRRRLNDEAFSRKVLALTAVNLFWFFLQMFAVFKILVTGNPSWAKYLFYVSLAGAVLSRIFWPELKRWAVSFYGSIIHASNISTWNKVFDIVFPLIVVFLIFVPDLTKVLATMFTRDQFYHIDSLLMAPGWAHLNGLVLNRDVTSEYSVAMPIVVSHVARLIGGFNYHNVIVVLMAVTMIYYVGFYFFLRRWLGGTLLAAFGVLLAMKLQMFHWGVSPIIWQFPSATVIRYWFDLTALFFVLRHLETFQPKYLWAAALVCAAALAFMFDTGIYLTATFYVYLLTLLLYPSWRKETFALPKNILNVAGLCLTPLVVGFLLLWLVQGPSIFTKDFWQNAFEFAALFLQGWGALPIFNGLKDRQFFAFIMGFIIPVVYVWTMIFVGALCFMRQIERKNFFVVVLCVYGLGLYHYFINRSAVSSYYVVCIPFVCVVCFWIQHLTSLFYERAQRNFKLGLLIAMTGALLTSYFFTYYPNALSLGGDIWKDQIKFYKDEFDFSRDAALIDSLTSADERVPLVSSFETAILMQAKRKPFFYYFPFIESSHMKLAAFRGTYLHTVARMQKTLKQLIDTKPKYVFIERKLFKRQIPPEYYQYYQTLSILIQYLDSNYTADQEGQYLIALKLKN